MERVAHQALVIEQILETMKISKTSSIESNSKRMIVLLILRIKVYLEWMIEDIMNYYIRTLVTKYWAYTVLNGKIRYVNGTVLRRKGTARNTVV